MMNMEDFVMDDNEVVDFDFAESSYDSDDETVDAHEDLDGFERYVRLKYGIPVA